MTQRTKISNPLRNQTFLKGANGAGKTKLEKSAGVVLFRKAEGKIFYLLLHYEMGHWGFPKGNIEKGESIEQTIRRETKEETGIKNIKFLSGFKEHIKYFYKLKGRGIFKIVTYLLAETDQKQVKLSFEHTDCEWLTYEQAVNQLTFKNIQEVLKKANDFLAKNA